MRVIAATQVPQRPEVAGIEDRGVRGVGRTFRMRDATARALLVDALDAWPDCYGWARDRVDEDDIVAVQRRLS